MNFQREFLTPRLWEEMLPLFYTHWKETGHYRDIKLEPDVEQYETAVKSGAVQIYTARENDELKGYCVFIVRSHPHYRSSIQAVADLLYLSKDMRGRMVGPRFIKWCDEQLKAQNVQVVMQHTKVTHNFGPLLARIGYELVDHVYARRLN